MSGIVYYSGYKYLLAETYACQIGIKPERAVSTNFVELGTDGWLKIHAGYAWDGPSGPTVDTRNFMRGSLVHDALYQLMRERHIDRDKWKDTADKLLRQMCLEDGMSTVRAWWVYHGVSSFGRGSTLPENNRPLLTAP